MTVYINKDLCIGCGLCASIAPNLFSIGKDGLAELINKDIKHELDEATHEATSSCPVEAILIK